MSLSYIRVFLSALLFTLGGVGLYYVYLSHETTRVAADTTTSYRSGFYVDHPIQPIPEVRSIDMEWVALGNQLFHSPLLSRDNSVSCASCHNLVTGGDDNIPQSIGIDGHVNPRNSPTVVNAVFNFRQFWDGRSEDLAAQAIGPIHAEIEMDSNFDQIIFKLIKDPEIKARFDQLDPETGVSRENIIKSLVTFQEFLVTPGAPIDRYLLGDAGALNPQQQRGLEKFVSMGCVGCHQGRNIGGNLYQKFGRLTDVPASFSEDQGRFELTGVEHDRNVFKVPSLRNVKLTAPYFHNGSVAELSEAIRIMARAQLGLELSDQDVSDLMALMDSFTSELPDLSRL